MDRYSGARLEDGDVQEGRRERGAEDMGEGGRGSMGVPDSCVVDKGNVVGNHERRSSKGLCQHNVHCIAS